MVSEVHWEITNNCNFHCVHCYLAPDSRPELSTEKCLELLDEMSRHGVLYLTISGGEPLLRRDFAEIYTRAHELGLLLNVFTNGSRITDEILQLFQARPPQKVEITLNGISPEVFESVTAKAGSYEATFAGIRKLSEAGIFLGIKTNGMKLNQGEVHAIKRFVATLPNAFFKFDTAIMPRRNHDREPTKLRLSPREIFNLYEGDAEFREAIEKECSTMTDVAPEERRLFSCDAGSSRFHISAWGDLHPCHTVRPIRESLLTNSFSHAVDLVQEKVTKMKYAESSPCGSCRIFAKCDSCPGLAHLEGKDHSLDVAYHCDVAHQTVGRYAPVLAK